MDQPVLEAEWSVVTRMAAGERAALAELYATHRGPLLAYLRALVADPGLSEEVLQDTLYAAWTGAAGFGRWASVRVWLLGIARRRAHDAVRRRTIHAVAAAELETLPTPEPKPESLVIANARMPLWRKNKPLSAMTRAAWLIDLVPGSRRVTAGR